MLLHEMSSSIPYLQPWILSQARWTDQDLLFSAEEKACGSNKEATVSYPTSSHLHETPRKESFRKEKLSFHIFIQELNTSKLSPMTNLVSSGPHFLFQAELTATNSTTSRTFCLHFLFLKIPNNILNYNMS